MDRELAFVLLVLLVCGPVIWLAAALPEAKHSATLSGRQLERLGWRSIWFRLLPCTAVLGSLLGWAVQEPEPMGESLPPGLLVLLIPVGVVWLRAALRSALALAPLSSTPAAATVGLFRPRVVVAPKLVCELDARALHALRQHEEAHARHRDPLRIWLAQLATDLQWPLPSARSRFGTWLHALELARDEEARLRGVDGEDLAAAIVAVAAMGQTSGGGLLARLTGDGLPLRVRVARLLSPLPAAPPLTRASLSPWLAMTTCVLAGFLLGVHYGETVIQSVPGVVKGAHLAIRLADFAVA